MSPNRDISYPLNAVVFRSQLNNLNPRSVLDFSTDPWNIAILVFAFISFAFGYLLGSSNTLNKINEVSATIYSPDFLI